MQLISLSLIRYSQAESGRDQSHCAIDERCASPANSLVVDAAARVCRSMPPDNELWKLALNAERDHGAGAARYIARMIVAAASNDDQAGINLWRAVAYKLKQLLPQCGT